MYGDGLSMQCHLVCQQCVGAPYSFWRYVPCVRGLQWTRRFFSESAQSAAHCSNLCARVLARCGGVDADLADQLATTAPAVGPSKLYNRIAMHQPSVLMRTDTDVSRAGELAAVLLCASDGDLQNMHVDEADDALCVLCANVSNACPDKETAVAERQLARALIRWTTELERRYYLFAEQVQLDYQQASDSDATSVDIHQVGSTESGSGHGHADRAAAGDIVL